MRPGDQCAPARCTDASHGVGPAVCPSLDAACPIDAAVPFDCKEYVCAEALGTCLTQCVASTDCAPGFTCDLPSARCIAAPPTDDSGGCAIGTSPERAAPWMIASAVALLALGSLRRLGARGRRAR